jgi:hypothetical protein
MKQTEVTVEQWIMIRCSYEIYGSHANVTEDSGLHGKDDVSLGKWFLVLQSIRVRSSSRIKQ